MQIVAEDSTVKGYFNTKRFSSGAPYTLAGTPSMYARVDGSDTEITTGFTLTADADSKTGQNRWVLDLSASASFTAGSKVHIFIGAGTVDSVSAADTLVETLIIGTTASLDALITRGMTALPNAAAAANGGLPTVNASNYVAGIAGTLNTLDALDTAQDSQHSTTQSAISAVETDTQDIQSRLPAALVGGRMDSNMQAAANNVITASVIADGAIDAATFAADVDAEILSYLVDDATRIDASAVNAITADWTNGGRLDLIIDELTTQGDTNQSKIDTIDGIVDAILVDTGTTLPATLATLTGTAGTITGAVSASQFDDSGSFMDDNAVDTMCVYFRTGSNAGLSRPIAAYDGTSLGNGRFTVEPAFPNAPQVGDTYDVRPINSLPGSLIATAFTSANYAAEVRMEMDSNSTQLAAIYDKVDTEIATIITNLATAQADLDTITGADGVIIASGTQTFNMTGNITGNLSGSVGTLTGHTPQTGDTYALANGSSGFAAIYGKVDTEIATLISGQSTLGTAISGVLTALGDGTVVLHTDYDAAKTAASQTTANADHDATQAAIAALNNLSSAGAQSAAAAALTAWGKTGFSLASTGLDSIATTAPAGVASNFREMIVQTWRRFFKKATHDSGAGEIKTFADDGTTVLTTQAATTAGDVETQGAAT